MASHVICKAVRGFIKVIGHPELSGKPTWRSIDMDRLLILRTSKTCQRVYKIKDNLLHIQGKRIDLSVQSRFMNFRGSTVSRSTFRNAFCHILRIDRLLSTLFLNSVDDLFIGDLEELFEQSKDADRRLNLPCFIFDIGLSRHTDIGCNFSL